MLNCPLAAATWHLPHLPTRHDILARAMAMFAETPSMEDIVNRAHAVILDTIGARLAVMLPARRSDEG